MESYDEIEDNNGNDTSSPTLDAPDKDKEKSEAARHLTKEAKQAAVLNKTKLLIEQLLLQETFSWEECEKLTHIIKSRVMVAPVSYREAGRQSEVYGAALKDAEMPHLSTALMEAKKWIKEKKSGSIPELDLDPIVSSHVNEGEIGSPVDLAKSFMKDSRPSASPCFTSKAERTTSPIGIQLFEDDELSSRGGNPVSSSKVQSKRDAPIIGLWNISEEIRRVRSKATEQLLSTPSTKNDLSASKPRSSASKFERSGLVMENMYSMNSSAPNIVEDGLRGGVLTSARVNQLEKEEPLLLNPPVLLSEQDKDLDGKMMNGVRNDETIVISDSVDVVDGVTNRDTNGNEMNESYLSLPCAQISDSLPKEVSGTGDASLQNGLLHSSTRVPGQLQYAV
ncbi:hypothetical protein SAY87_009724 [Trapa incisa]|uniref:Uncharacterized protein n=1 Tax=Trapa incisa TaxID=236973 RepID=A0AAN7JZ89_9MYRT|nr:hypothetical protein SAY87_009724 [Trapa incisa]